MTSPNIANPALPHDSDGRLSAYAWPGGYPLVYLCMDGGILCPDCANGENGSATTDPDCADDPQWQLREAFIHYEGPPEVCDHCAAEVFSAYGDPECATLKEHGACLHCAPEDAP